MKTKGKGALVAQMVKTLPSVQGLIPGSGRSLGEGSRNPPQYSCQVNPMDREAWRATVHDVTESDMTE